MSESTSFEQYVLDFVSKLPVSRPIFEASMDERNIYFEVKDTVNIDFADIADPVERLIASESQESFNKNSNKKVFVRDCSVSSVYHKMTFCVMTVYENNCGLKNPRSSSMYKWLNTVYNKYNDETYKGFVALYRYIALNADVNSRRFAENGNLGAAHAKNVIAVLERMRNKYEDK